MSGTASSGRTGRRGGTDRKLVPRTSQRKLSVAYNLDRKLSIVHNTDRAEMNWKATKAKTVSVGFFGRRIEKPVQREILTNFMDKMKGQSVKDEEELSRKLKEYTIDDAPSSITTLRPRSAERKEIPFADLPTHIKYDVKPGSKCVLCKVVFPVFRELEEAFPCRVCDDLFHKPCLNKCGDLTDVDKRSIDKARTNVGWSCPQCSDLSLLLTKEEVDKMTEEFEKINFNQDVQISLPEYIRHFSRRQSLTDKRDQLSSEELERVSRKFNGKLNWWEFVNHESKARLARKDKYDLVALLTKKELCAAKATFKLLDRDDDGKIKDYELKEAFKKWFRQFEKFKPNFKKEVVKDTEILDVFSQMIMDANNKKREEVNWEDFILDQALYILCCRPNTII